ncbi:hypothetical protein JO972_14925 [Verrucomicrobiaceae bacterium 5K15]|uniref:Uncharacterized protein n=1 Tax=Oceaniferula flava TaxID=2800421 RepID=A0AAE2SDH9_9BACT|nr:hypothetical protein [Oceaniferula flavus]MBK1856261.1 hypothetical protein [Oceaniferula flavus]MBM1137568.1 hypothetical protein [Oceaniferula flavus]
MTWFEELTGFAETESDAVRANLECSGAEIRSRVNGGRWTCGTLELASLADLRQRACKWVDGSAPRVRQLVANVQNLHADPQNAGALFQVASQFNLLEMISSQVTPEQGVGIYGQDFTQGPACAIAAGAGTIYRHYFADIHGQIGQTATRQLDALAGLGAALGNVSDRLWTMQNGYALASASGLVEISTVLDRATSAERETLKGHLQVGFQRSTQVTIRSCSHLVSQVYASALPVAYSSHAPAAWSGFARLVLEAAYEATLCAAQINAAETGNRSVYLTLLGGGAFGNSEAWIIDAIDRALRSKFSAGLDIQLVSYGSANPALDVLTMAS